MFLETHTKKSDGTPVDAAFEVVMTQMQDLPEQVSQGVASYTDEEIFSHVMGPERHRRMRACGASPTPTSHYGGQSSGNNQLQEKVNGQDAMIQDTRKELDETKKDLGEYKNQMDDMKRQINFLMSLNQQLG